MDMNSHANRTLVPDFLENRLVKVLSFAAEHVPKLSSYVDLWQDEDAQKEGLRDKVLAETAILTLLASRVGGLSSEGRHLTAQLANILEEATRGDDVTALLLRCPHLAVPAGLVQIVLGHMGRGDPGIQHVVRGILASDFLETMERVPYRTMEARWAASLLNGADTEAAAALLDCNVATKPVHPITMNRSTAYGVTHGIMYCTDFGAVPPPAALQTDLVRARVDATLAWLTINEDLDLLIEFILSATLLRMPWSPYVRLAWVLCNEVWDELAFLPSPTFLVEKYAALDGEAARAYAFRHVYHTNFVGGLLAATLLTMPRRPLLDPWVAPRLSYGHAASACAQAARKARLFAGAIPNGEHWPSNDGADADAALGNLTELLTAMLPRYRHWQRAAAHADLAPITLAMVLGDAAIIHAARQYDLSKVIRALNETLFLPQAPSLTVVEGAMFLARQQLEDGCLGVQFIRAENRRSRKAREATNTMADYLQYYSGEFVALCTPASR